MIRHCSRRIRRSSCPSLCLDYHRRCRSSFRRRRRAHLELFAILILANVDLSCPRRPRRRRRRHRLAESAAIFRRVLWYRAATYRCHLIRRLVEHAGHQ